MRPVDWIIVIAYVLTVTGLGIWFGRRQNNIEDYFLGGHSIPWWAALMSLIATEISAATFLGAPEQGYTHNLTYLQFSVGTIAARFAIAYLFIGIYYRFKVYTVYGYLMARFGLGTNTVTASVFMLGRLFADGARLFIASLAIHVATGLGQIESIVALAFAATIYTLFGGIKGVIWTEVMQASVLIGGALILVVSLLGHIGMPFGDIINTISAAGKFKLFDFDMAATGIPHFFTAGPLVGAGDGLAALAPLVNPYNAIPAIIGGFFLTMATHGTDQDMVQRLLTCKESGEGKRSLWMSGFIGLAITTVFMFIGQLLFVYIGHLPATDAMATTAAKLATENHKNQLILYYIVNVLPAGVTGLVLASVIAAALSSLGSGINATSSTIVTDLYQRYVKRDGTPQHYVTASKTTTCIVGLIDACIALGVAYFAQIHPELDLLSIALGVMTFFYGGLLGIFLVSIFSRTRGNSLTNALGVAASILTVLLLKNFTALAWPWFIVIGTLITMAISVCGRTPRAIQESYREAEAASLAA